MTPTEFKQARRALGLTQAQLGVVPIIFSIDRMRQWRYTLVIEGQ